MRKLPGNSAAIPVVAALIRSVLNALVIPPLSLAMFLPNRYTRTDGALLGKNLLGAQAVDHFKEGIRCRKSPRIRSPGR